MNTDWDEVVDRHRDVFLRHGLDSHQTDFSGVRPVAIEAMAQALLALEAPPAPPAPDRALLLDIAGRVRNVIAMEVGRQEDLLRAARRRGAAAEMQIVVKFCAMHVDLGAIVDDALLKTSQKKRRPSARRPAG